MQFYQRSCKKILEKNFYFHYDILLEITTRESFSRILTF